MIIDLERFLKSERRYWNELESILGRLEREPNYRMTLDETQRFHLLYERTAADLARMITFASERETKRYLEHLVARAYGEMHETRERRSRFSFMQWFFQTLPRTFRAHIRAFYMSVAITLAGAAFGGLAIALDPSSKAALMPFSHLQQDPAERVAQEEAATNDRLEGRKTSFSAFLMTHNTRVSIFTLALGMTWGMGTTIMLFYNGVTLGAVVVDYIRAGQTTFLLGWLLPHGAVEIPSILIAGQAGLMLGLALVGWGERTNMRTRLRAVSRDIVTLIFGVGLLLIWAGIIESFLSQYHEPVVPYYAKISFGMVEIVLLFLFLGYSGRTPREPMPSTQNIATE